MTDAPKDPFGLDRKWRSATNRIIAMIDTGMAGDGLPIGPASSLGIERYAREVVAANPQNNLGIMYGLVSVATAAATQGGFLLRVPVAGGGWLEAPSIQYFVGIAPSGWRKSTALKTATDPLKRALNHGESLRRIALPKEKDLTERDTLPQLKVGVDLDPKQFAEIFNGGVCPVTMVKDPTVEGLRNALCQHGGAIAVFSGEPDVFRNVGAFSTDSGSLTFLLDGWSQEDISTIRAGSGLLAIDEAALFLGVLLQTGVFAEVTAGSGNGDSFQERGMLGRMLIVEAENSGGWAEIAQNYSDDNPWDQHEGEDGMSDRYGDTSLLGLALADYAHNLRTLVEDTNKYRMTKALRRSWLAASTKYGNDLQCPEIDPPSRTIIKLDPDALVVYSRIQRMYNALEAHLADADEDVAALWGPMVSRFVQHVLREALIVSLGAGRRTISAEILEDAALRIFPWRWGLSTRALVKRNAERQEDVIAGSFATNSRHDDLSPEAKVRKVLVLLYAREIDQREHGWTAREIVRRATSTISPKSARRGIGPRLNIALETLLKDPDSGVSCIETATDRPGTASTKRYFISPQVVENNRR